MEKRKPRPEKVEAEKLKSGKLDKKKLAQMGSFEEQEKSLQLEKGESESKTGRTPKPKAKKEVVGSKKSDDDKKKSKSEEKPPTDIYDYGGLSAWFEDRDHAQKGVDLDDDIRVQENGGLFIEAINSKAESDYYERAPEMPKTTTEEKLHVPATGRDVSQRWAIVSKLCLARGIVNWKVAKQELLDNKVSGADKAFDLLGKAGLLDTNAPPGLATSAYVKQSLKPDRRETLRKFLGNPKMFDKWPDGELAQEVIVKIENSILDAKAFPEEQTGREITVYIKPELLPTTKMWSEFVSELYGAFDESGLPMLPIAVGDKAVAGGGKKSKGQTLGYFSYRNEANANDKLLGYKGFPHWAGGNADKTNAAKQKMQLDKAKVKKPKTKRGKGKKEL
ncbi:MAG: hypothetical protein U1F43_26080 [Myxococcota bacterium]